MKVTYYRQCRLVKPLDRGEVQQVSWIPEPHATVGAVLRLLEGPGTWSDGWRVVEAGRNRLRTDQLPDFHTMRKAHRRASGDAEPRTGGGEPAGR
jgi:hypothetical protein